MGDVLAGFGIGMILGVVVGLSIALLALRVDPHPASRRFMDRNTGTFPVREERWSEAETLVDLLKRLYPPVSADEDPATGEYERR